MGVLSLPRPLNLMYLTARSHKINLNPANLNLLTPTSITPLMKKLTEKNKIRGLLHLQATGKQPKLPLTDEIVIHLSTSKVQRLFKCRLTLRQLRQISNNQNLKMSLVRKLLSVSPSSLGLLWPLEENRDLR